MKVNQIQVFQDVEGGFVFRVTAVNDKGQVIIGNARAESKVQAGDTLDSLLSDLSRTQESVAINYKASKIPKA